MFEVGVKVAIDIGTSDSDRVVEGEALGQMSPGLQIPPGAGFAGISFDGVERGCEGDGDGANDGVEVGGSFGEAVATGVGLADGSATGMRDGPRGLGMMGVDAGRVGAAEGCRG
jgi:hypothetical protein